MTNSNMMTRSLTPVLLTTLSLGTMSFSLSLPTMAGSVPIAPAPTPDQLAQFSPADRPPPITADGGGARFGEFVNPDLDTVPESGDNTTRSTCVAPSPLMPQYGGLAGSFYAKTESDSPQFYFYSPPIDRLDTGVKTATLLIFDDPAGEPVYEQTFQVPTTIDAIVSVRIDPESGFSLDNPGQYQWYLDFYCDQNDPTKVAYTSGWIERTPEEEAIGLGIVGTSEAVAEYGKAAIWFEYMENLIAASTDNWGYILAGLRETIGSREDLSTATVTPYADGDDLQNDDSVQIFLVEP